MEHATIIDQSNSVQFLEKSRSKIIKVFEYCCCVEPGQHSEALPLPLFDRTGGENKVAKLMDSNRDSEITYQLTSQAKQTQLGKIQFNLLPTKIDLNVEKQG